MAFGKKPAANPAGIERRSRPRNKADLPAHIVLPDGQAFPCRIRNHARGTARLSLPSVLGIPATFALHTADAVYEARTIRRDAGTLVVRFS